MSVGRRLCDVMYCWTQEMRKASFSALWNVGKLKENKYSVSKGQKSHMGRGAGHRVESRMSWEEILCRTGSRVGHLEGAGLRKG